MSSIKFTSLALAVMVSTIAVVYVESSPLFFPFGLNGVSSKLGQCLRSITSVFPCVPCTRDSQCNARLLCCPTQTQPANTSVGCCAPAVRG